MKSNYEQVESLWAKIRGQANKGSLMVGVYYRPPKQGEDVDKTFLLQLQDVSCLQALILLEDFNHPDICWKYSTESCRQPSRLLERVKDCFLIQLIDRLTRREVLLDLLLTNMEYLIRYVKIGGSLGCSDHDLVEFTVLKGTDHMNSLDAVF